MGIFDKILKPESAIEYAGTHPVRFSSEAFAFIGILYACSEDGFKRDQQEVNFIVKIVNIKPLLHNVDMPSAIQEYFEILNLIKIDALLYVAGSQLTLDNKKSVFINCFDMVFADSVVSSREKSFMDQLARYLGLDQSFIDSVSEMIRLKYL